MPLTRDEIRRVRKYALRLRRLSKGVKIQRPIEPMLRSMEGFLQEQRIDYKRKLLELVGDCGYTSIRRIFEYKLPGKIPDLKDRRETILEDMDGLGWVTEYRGWFRPDFGTGVGIDAFVAELCDAASDAESMVARRDMAFTDTESIILEALGSEHKTGPVLLKAAGYDYSSHYRGILSSLVKRGVLGNDDSGYFRRQT
ncbi:MAG: hypothetical protein JW955_19700 [Sedimentisphaerales bacterium]|nr:hypothetical protein [Sedimentisphaerales bacterium]